MMAESTIKTVQIESGRDMFGGASQVLNITFSRTFTSVPRVVATLEGSKGYTMAECDGTVYVSNITTSGATIEINRVANNNAVVVYWVAVNMD